MAENTKAEQVTRVGNLTRDPVLKFANSGRAYAHTAMAVEVPGPGNDWSKKTTTFYDLTLFGDVAEHAAESLAKGDRVIVLGTPEVKEYADKQGEVKAGKSIAVNSIGAELRWATLVVTKSDRSTVPTQTVNEVGSEEEPF